MKFTTLMFPSLQLFFQLLLMAQLILCVQPEKILASFTSEIGAGNYTYYSLHEMGEITIILTTISGDADLYISEHTQHPDYTNYDLSATTYGIDIVSIPTNMKRPAGVGVYGHIHRPLSHYKLVAVLNYTGTVNEAVLPIHIIETDSKESDGKFNFLSSFMWQFLEVIVKILAEVLLW